MHWARVGEAKLARQEREIAARTARINSLRGEWVKLMIAPGFGRAAFTRKLPDGRQRTLGWSTDKVAAVGAPAFPRSNLVPMVAIEQTHDLRDAIERGVLVIDPVEPTTAELADAIDAEARSW